MRYQVPQFIEVEDKIFGPLTFKQFAYVVGGAGICFIAYRFLPFIVAILFIIPIGGFSLALAFYKVNNRPFIFVVESAVKFLSGERLYIWKKDLNRKKAVVENKDNLLKITVPKLSESKLRELTWSLDINESMESKEKQRSPINNEDKISSFKGLSVDMKNSNFNQ